MLLKPTGTGYFLLKRNQHGSALVLAVFVIVVVMLLGASLVKLLSTSSETLAQEVLGTRALAAANSAMQAQLQKLFPLNDGPPTFTCPAPPSTPASYQYDFSSIKGLFQCKAVVDCSNYATHNSINYYRLHSTGICGDDSAANSKAVFSRRKVTVEAKSLAP